MRSALAALAGALVLAGCPIPQAVPDYPPGTVTPPRILVDEIVGDGNPMIFVPSNCVTAPTYPLSARIVDTNTIESVDARWFVNYDHRFSRNRTQYRDDEIPPNADTTNLIREVPPRNAGGLQQFFDFTPYDFEPAGAPTGSPSSESGIVRVVELVVSNGFDPLFDNTTAPLANRAPKRRNDGGTMFETQVHRWVFLTVPQSSAHRCP